MPSVGRSPQGRLGLSLSGALCGGGQRLVAPGCLPPRSPSTAAQSQEDCAGLAPSALEPLLRGIGGPSALNLGPDLSIWGVVCLATGLELTKIIKDKKHLREVGQTVQMISSICRWGN